MVRRLDGFASQVKNLGQTAPYIVALSTCVCSRKQTHMHRPDSESSFPAKSNFGKAANPRPFRVSWTQTASMLRCFWEARGLSSPKRWPNASTCSASPVWLFEADSCPNEGWNKKVSWSWVHLTPKSNSPVDCAQIHWVLKYPWVRCNLGPPKHWGCANENETSCW